MESTQFEAAEKALKQEANRLQIPDADFDAGIEYAAQFIQDNPLTEGNRTNYFILMAISAYSAGKEAAKA